MGGYRLGNPLMSRVEGVCGPTLGVQYSYHTAAYTDRRGEQAAHWRTAVATEWRVPLPVRVFGKVRDPQWRTGLQTQAGERFGNGHSLAHHRAQVRIGR